MAYDVGQTCMLVNMGLTRGECASWVQAWRSIGAILATAMGVFVAHRLQEQRDREQRKGARVDRLFKLVDSTVNGVAYVQTHLSDKTRIQAARLGRPNIDPDGVQSLGDLLAPIPLHELDDPEVAFEILLLTKNVQQIREVALTAVEHVEDMPEAEITKALH